jgi:peptidylprolyl isomerase
MVPRIDGANYAVRWGQEVKVFWFFFSKKNSYRHLQDVSMKRPFLLVLLLAAAAPDPVVAVRGSDAITASQARALIAAADPQTRQRLQTDPTAVTALVRDTLLQHAILAEAEAHHWDENPEVAALLRRTREQVLLQSYLASQAVVPAGYPTDADIQAAYNQNKAQLMQPRAYHLMQATLQASAGQSSDAARQKLTDLQKDIAHGRVKFADAAKRVPGVQISDLGWQPENRLLPAARDAVSGLLEGQVSAPVCNPAGCALLQLTATRPAGPAQLADVRDGLIRALRQQKQRQLEQTYTNTLLAKQPVQVNEIELSHLTAP